MFSNIYIRYSIPVYKSIVTIDFASIYISRMPWRQALELGAPEVASGYVQSEAAAEHMREVDVLTYAKQRHAVGSHINC